MSVATLAPPHPIVGCVSALRDVLAEVADVQPAFMAAADKRLALVQLAQARAQLAELELRVLAASDEVGDANGARDSAAWLAHATRSDPRAAHAERRLAAALERYERLAGGMRSGTVSEEQARVVAAALDDLPAHLGREAHAAAEATMVRHCAEFGPRELRLLGRRLVEVAAPEVAEAEDGKRLEAEERRAREQASLRFRDLGDGRTRVSGTLPTGVTQRLQHYLQAWTSPRRPGAADPGERLPQHRAYAHAFGELLEAIDPDRLPQHGGDATTVMVTVSLDQLRAELATAGVIAGDGEEMISASAARRLACQATIVPAVLGGRSEVLDLGRARRLYNGPQRRAMRLRDRRCRAEGCTIPAAWTEAHHLRPWSAGGRTDLADGVSLCARHHHRIHDSGYGATRLPDGDIRFHRRT